MRTDLVHHNYEYLIKLLQERPNRKSSVAPSLSLSTFMTATEVFGLLAAQYKLDIPPNLSEEEFEQWKREKLRPTQKCVLTVLTMWLKEYDLLNQDPDVASKLQDFLCLIVTPPALALTVKHMLKSLEHLIRLQ